MWFTRKCTTRVFLIPATCKKILTQIAQVKVLDIVDDTSTQFADTIQAACTTFESSNEDFEEFQDKARMLGASLLEMYNFYAYDNSGLVPLEERTEKTPRIFEALKKIVLPIICHLFRKMCRQ